MPDYTTPYSAVIAEHLTPDEAAWCERALDIARRWYHDRGEILPSVHLDKAGSNVNIGIQDDDGGDIAEAVRLAQMFFNRWRPNAVASIQFAHTCSTARIEACGGGAVVFTAETQEWLHTGLWVSQMTHRLQTE